MLHLTAAQDEPTGPRYPEGLARLLGEIETGPSVPDQLERAAFQLSGMHRAGEFAPLPDYLRTEIAALALALLGWADRLRDERPRQPLGPAIISRATVSGRFCAAVACTDVE